MFPELYPTGGTIELTRDMVRGIGHLGGTILGSTNRGNPTAFPVQLEDGTWTTVDRTEELVGLFKEAGIDALITIGGDGSLAIAGASPTPGWCHRRAQDDRQRPRQDGCHVRIRHGREVATESIDRLFTDGDVAQQGVRRRVDGARYAGWIALNAGVGGRRPRDPHPGDPVSRSNQWPR
jgi:6-phosphofructokinase 1